MKEAKRYLDYFKLRGNDGFCPPAKSGCLQVEQM